MHNIKLTFGQTKKFYHLNENLNFWYILKVYSAPARLILLLCYNVQKSANPEKSAVGNEHLTISKHKHRKKDI